MSTKKEAACYSVRAGAVAGGWCRPSWTRGAAAAEGFQLFDFLLKYDFLSLFSGPSKDYEV